MGGVRAGSGWSVNTGKLFASSSKLKTSTPRRTPNSRGGLVLLTLLTSPGVLACVSQAWRRFLLWHLLSPVSAIASAPISGVVAYVPAQASMPTTNVHPTSPAFSTTNG